MVPGLLIHPARRLGWRRRCRRDFSRYGEWNPFLVDASWRASRGHQAARHPGSPGRAPDHAQPGGHGGRGGGGPGVVGAPWRARLVRRPAPVRPPFSGRPGAPAWCTVRCSAAYSCRCSPAPWTAAPLRALSSMNAALKARAERESAPRQRLMARKIGLNRNQVVDAAAGLADAEGLQNLSLARVAVVLRRLLTFAVQPCRRSRRPAPRPGRGGQHPPRSRRCVMPPAAGPEWTRSRRSDMRTGRSRARTRGSTQPCTRPRRWKTLPRSSQLSARWSRPWPVCWPRWDCRRVKPFR